MTLDELDGGLKEKKTIGVASASIAETVWNFGFETPHAEHAFGATIFRKLLDSYAS